MCGRFTLTSDLRALELRFNFRGADLDYTPRYNVAPTQEALTVVRDGENRAEYMRWGLVPFWAKDAAIGSRMINARAEGIAEKPAFRNAFKKRRCLILADGFYEWRKEGKTKTPMRIVLKSREPFAFAGLWESWKAPDGESLHSCTIATTTPNELIAAIHNRMPVILSEEAERIWLDPEQHDARVLNDVLIPFPAGSMEAYQVSDTMNSARNDTPECVKPVA